MNDVTQSSQDWEDFWYNSPTNSPYIVMTKQLTSAQRDELIEQFVEIQLDNMDTQSLYELASEYVTQSFDRLTDSEIKERIESLHDAELYDELVDNVISNPTEVI